MYLGKLPVVKSWKTRIWKQQKKWEIGKAKWREKTTVYTYQQLKGDDGRD